MYYNMEGHYNVNTNTPQYVQDNSNQPVVTTISVDSHGSSSINQPSNIYTQHTNVVIPQESASITQNEDILHRILPTLNVLLDGVAVLDHNVKDILDLNKDYAEKFVKQDQMIRELQQEVLQQRKLLEKLLPTEIDEKSNVVSNKQKNLQYIYTFRTETARSAYPQFEQDLQIELQKELKKQNPSKPFSFSIFKQEQTDYEVKNVQSINEIDKNNAKILLLCSFASASRVEGETVAPYYNLFQKELPNSKILCSVFRFGTNAAPAKILFGTTSGNREEEIPSICFSFISSGWTVNLSANSLNYILSYLK